MKSRTTSAVLTLLFGPLGLFYTSFWAALALTVLAFASAPTIIGPLFAWVVSIFWSDSLVRKHNSAMNVQAAPQPEPAVNSEPAQAPAPVQAPAHEKKGISLVPGPLEMIVYAAIAVFLVFFLPDMLGRPEGVSAMAFYMDLLGI